MIQAGVEISIIDPFSALWMITCPAFVFLETLISDARPVFSMHIGKELTDGLEKYVFRAELDALVQAFSTDTWRCITSQC